MCVYVYVYRDREMYTYVIFLNDDYLSLGKYCVEYSKA